MKYPEVMKVSESNAEYKIWFVLQARKLTNGMDTQQPWYRKDGTLITISDFEWFFPQFYYFDFIDGGIVENGVAKLHLSLRQERKDIAIKKELEALGHVVDRFPYKPPLTVHRKFEICDSIQEHLLELGYKPVIS